MTSKVGKDLFFVQRNMLVQAMYLNKMDEDFSRASGRSLALGFELIAKCLKNYNMWHEVTDHHPNGDRGLLKVVFDVVDELNLKGFYYRKIDNKIIFDLKQELQQNDMIPRLTRLGN